MIYVINHKYHYDYLRHRIKENDFIVIVSDIEFNVDENLNFFKIPYFESMSVLRKIVFRFLFSFVWLRLSFFNSSLIRDDVCFFGCQDVVSYWIYKKSMRRGVYVVPDNFEFYGKLVYKNYKASFFNFRILLRAMLYGVLLDYFAKNVVFFNGRFFYDIDARELNPLFICGEKCDLMLRQEESVFVSQPYYIDYRIDVDVWCNRLAKVLREKRCSKILAHPRDNKYFLDKMKLMGFDFVDDDGFGIYYGVFSTLMATLASRGCSVVSLLESFRGVLPDSYISFSATLMREVGIKNINECWPRLSKENFNK